MHPIISPAWLWLLHPFLVHAQTEPQTYRASFTVNLVQRYQTIDGFGFCEAFQRAHSISNLPQPFQNEVLDLLFNTTTGAGFSIFRVGLGSSEDSRGDHMNSPQPSPDIEFHWDGYDSGQVWVAKQAQRYGVETFYADAWSAPGWMKTNGRDDQGGRLCGVRGEGSANGTKCGTPPVSYIDEYSQYLARYVKEYIDAGIPIRHVGFLNEPNLVKNYATMQSTGSQAADIIPSLTRALSKLNLATVGISCCEAQGWSMARDLLTQLSSALPNFSSYLSIVTTHTYKGSPPGPDIPLETQGLPTWVSEISPIMDRLGLTTTWYLNHAENEGLRNAINIHEALTKGNASAYIYWIGAGQSKAEAPFIWAPNRPERVSSGGIVGGRYTIGSTYWASAHFSRFIRSGARRVEVRQEMTGGRGGSLVEEGTLLLSAYDNLDGSVVVQVINNSDVAVGEIEVELWDQLVRFGSDGKRDVSRGLEMRGQDCEVETWVTDNERRFVVVASGEKLWRDGSFRGPLPARSLTTYVVRCVQWGS
ncbi:glycoside hydrolase family 30 protein [Rhypophila decipiens]|uniref:Glycoside hydrolase family 30 protein n=1 Tax=Rhypophila decipiens TaxID=261697 RepID=A0AAN7B6X8_9PEZI|nr:glycoside hydrolase family 30 protein [Rhypophila decipiens]